MDFTPPPNSNSNSNPPPIHANPISSIPSSRKLPIKRKTPFSNPNSTLTLTPQSPHDATPPFKRIWTEPDEIRLLQGLLHFSSQGFSFPRDLPLFYAHFSHGSSMSQPYSKSQLSEKLRRLRKKFRVISSRLDKGLDYSQLSLQDQALFDLSKQLWDPDHHSSLPFAAGNNNNINNNNNNTNNNDIDNDNNNNNDGYVDCDGDDGNNNNNVSLPAVLALPSVVKKPGGKINKVEVKLVEKEVKVENDGGELRSGIGVFSQKSVVTKIIYQNRVL